MVAPAPDETMGEPTLLLGKRVPLTPRLTGSAHPARPAGRRCALRGRARASRRRPRPRRSRRRGARRRHSAPGAAGRTALPRDRARGGRARRGSRRGRAAGAAAGRGRSPATAPPSITPAGVGGEALDRGVDGAGLGARPTASRRSRHRAIAPRSATRRPSVARVDGVLEQLDRNASSPGVGACSPNSQARGRTNSRTSKAARAVRLVDARAQRDPLAGERAPPAARRAASSAARRGGEVRRGASGGSGPRRRPRSAAAPPARSRA